MALKVEQVLELKLALLPMDLRNLCSLEATHGIQNSGTKKSDTGDVQSQLLHSVTGARSRREQERKERLSEEHRKEKEGKGRDLLLWEQESLFNDTNRVKMESMWELPVIWHFVELLLEQLNISSIPIFELERMFLMPQASTSLAVLMTTLLSKPVCRLKLHTKPPMPYRIWTKKLELKVSCWYKMYIKSDKNANFMFEKFGVEHQFWKIMGEWNPLEEYEFHELTVYQRVLLIKSICDYILQNHKILRDTIAEKRDDFGKYLGHDRRGAKFFYFPQLLDQCVRIYRQTSEPKSWIDRDLEYAESLAEQCNGSTTTHKKCKRRNAWNRGKIVKQKNCSDIKITRKSTRSSPRCTEIGLSSLASTSNQSNGNSNYGTAVCEGEFCSNGSDLEPLQIVCSSPRAGPSPCRIKKTLAGVAQSDQSINISYGTDISLKTGMNFSQASVSEDLCTSHDESHLNKFSSESASPVFSSNLEPKQACNIDCDTKVIVEDKNNFIVEQSECVNTKSVPLYQTKNLNRDNDKTIKMAKSRRPLYNPHWLEPNPNDFRLVADTVEGVRQLLMKYHDDDSVVMDRRSCKKSGKGCRPSCEVKLCHQLSLLVSDLDRVEIKILINTRAIREKLYKEWVEFNNRPADYVDPDEAFWLNEKEPAETSECQAPETQASQTSDVLEDTELPQTQVIDPIVTAEDMQHTCANGMKLRQRLVTREKYDGLETSELSSEGDSDDTDTWVLSKYRKNRSKKRKRIHSPAVQCPLKKKHTLEECVLQPSLNQEETSPKMVPNSSQIKILDGAAKSAAKKRRVKRSPLQNEASSSEASRQLEQEQNCHKLANSPANKSSDTSRTMAFFNQTVKNTFRDANTKALLPLQCREIGDVIQTVKCGVRDGVVIDVINIEMEKDESNESVKQNVDVEVCDGKGQGGKSSSQTLVNTSERPRQPHGQKEVHRPTCVTPYKRSYTDVKTSDARGNEKQATGVPIITPPSGQVLKAHVSKSQLVTASNCNWNSNSGANGKALSSDTGQRQNNETSKQSLNNIQQVVEGESDIIFISDDSDDEVEFLCSEYNQQPDFQYQKELVNIRKNRNQTVEKDGVLTPKKMHIAAESDSYVHRKIPTSHMKPETSACSVYKPEHSTVRTQDSLTLKQAHTAPDSDPFVQRKIPTSIKKATASTGSIVTVLPNNFQSQVPSPKNYTTHLTHNSTVTSVKVDEQFLSKHENVGIHTVAENQDQVREEVSTYQPSGISCSILENHQLQTDSVEYVQSHTPELCTANRVLSPLPSSSTQNSQDIPVHDSVTVCDTVTSAHESSSVSNGLMPNLQINVGNEIVAVDIRPSHASSNMNPYIVIVGACPGTSVTHGTAPDLINRRTDSLTQVTSSDASLARTRSPVSKSNTTSKMPGYQLNRTRTSAPPVGQTGNPGVSFGKMKCSGVPVDRARIHRLPVSQTNHDMPIEVRNPGLPLIRTRNPVFSSAPSRSLYTPSAHTQHSDSLLANTKVPDTQLAQTNSSNTPTGQTRIPLTPVTKKRNSVTSAVQTKVPGSLVAHTRRSDSLHGMTRSPDKTNFMQAVSPGTSVGRTKNSVSPLFQAQTHDAHVNPGARLSHGRGHPSSGPERDKSDVQQQRDQTARLVVIPGNDNVSRYGLVFPSGAKVILTPEQVADIRAANGGLLTSVFGCK